MQELICEKIRVLLKSMNKKSKPGGKMRLETQIKKSNENRQKTIKQRENAETCWDKKKKATQEKITIQLEEIYQKVLVKEGRLKKISTRSKVIQIKLNIPKQRKKTLTSWGR